MNSVWLIDGSRIDLLPEMSWFILFDMTYERLRPYAEIDPADQAVLRLAYLHGQQRWTSIRGDELRFGSGAERERLQHLCERQLLTETSDQYRPTILGLLYLTEAQHDLKTLDALIKLAHARYRPGAPPLTVSEIAEAVPGLDVDALAGLAQYTPDVGLTLEGGGAPEKKQFRLALYEQSRLTPSLEQAIAQRWSLLSPRRSSEDFEIAPPFRLFLRELRASLFRALRDFSLPIGPLTVVVGPNGVGKSTVLDAINYLGQAVHHGVEGALSREGGLSRLRTRGSQGPVSVSTIFEIDYGKGVPSRGTFELAVDEVHGRVAVERELLMVESEGANPKPLVDGRRGRTRVMLQSGSFEERYHSPSGLAIAELAAHDMHPLWRDLRAALSRIVLVDRDPFVGESAWINFSRPRSFRRQRSSVGLDDIVAQVAASEELTQRMGELLREFAPSVGAVRRTVVTGEPPGLEVEEKGLAGRLTLDELSAGTRQMLLLAAVYLNPQPPSVLLLEEPDAGVHVGALPALVDLLHSLNKRMSVVVTTHSPALVGLLDPNTEVFALERTDSGVRAFSLEEALRSREWLKAFGTRSEAFVRAASERIP